MNKTKLKYVKYTKKELDQYVRDKNSCISLHSSEMHIGFPPWGFADFQENLTNIISRDKIGKYDTKLEGIVLDVRNIKVFGTSYPIRDDDPINHINIKADLYIFQPRIGTSIKGVVKHISHGHIAVIIYRVFNVSIRFNRENVRDALQINQHISFRIKKLDLSGALPYIEGEFIGVDAPKTKTRPTLNKHSRFDDNEVEGSGADSGISTEETNASIPKKKVVLKQEIKSESSSSSSSSSEESDSDSEADVNSKANLLDQLFKGINVKKEELSDSEEDIPVKKTSVANATVKTQDSSNESSSEDSKSEVDSDDEHTKQSITLKNIKKESSSSSSSSSSSESSSSNDSDSESSGGSESSDCPAQNKFKPISIKEEPVSDVEGEKFKKPSTPFRHNSNANQTAEKAVQKRRRTVSVTEKLDALMNEVMRSKEKDKRKSVPTKHSKLNDESMDIGNISALQSSALSSTLKPTSSKLKRPKLDLISPSKIKRESDSEGDIRKAKPNGKTSKSK